MDGTSNKRDRKQDMKNKYYKSLRSRFGVTLCVFMLLCILVACIGWIVHFLQQKSVSNPTSIPSRPVNSPHQIHTLSPPERLRRIEYQNNSFIQLLQQHQLVVNITDCWVCGLMPHTAHKGMPYLVLPFSYEGSAWAYLAMFSAAYHNRLRYPIGTFESRMDFSHTNLIKGIVTMAKIVEKGKIPLDERKTYEGWNVTHYISSLSNKTKQGKSAPVWTVPHQGNFCLQINDQKTDTKQNCTRTYVLISRDLPPLIPSQGTYFVCYDRAYTWLPSDFSGTCYIAFLLPPTYTASSDYHRRRYGRGIIDTKDTAGQEGGDFLKGFLPFWGPMVNSRNIRHLACVVETTIDVTAGALSNITAELQAERLMTLQNRIALDVILADRGGVCKLIGSSCCIYIPDDAPTVYQAISKLHTISESIHQDEGDWSFVGWIWGLLSTWGWKILMFLGAILAIIFSCCLCVQCGPTICGLLATLCVPQAVTQKTENIRMMVQQHLNDIMAIDVDSDSD